jgi:hypothetical protein
VADAATSIWGVATPSSSMRSRAAMPLVRHANVTGPGGDLDVTRLDEQVAQRHGHRRGCAVAVVPPLPVVVAGGDVDGDDAEEQGASAVTAPKMPNASGWRRVDADMVPPG